MNSGSFAVFGLTAGVVRDLEAHARRRTHGRVGVLIARIVTEWLRRNPVPEEDDDE